MLERLEPILALSDDFPAYATDPYVSRWRGFAGRGALLVVLVAAAFAYSLGSGFMWTDDAELTDNIWLRSGTALLQFWLKPSLLPSFPSFGPAAYSALWPQFRLWSYRYLEGYHGVSILVHTLVVLEVWVILRRLNVPGAWLAAAVFGLHPVHVQSVAWVSQQGNLWSTLFGLTSLLLYLRFAGVAPPLPGEWRSEGIEAETTDTGGPAAGPSGWLIDPDPPWLRGLVYAGSLLLFVLALLSKPATLLLPVTTAVLLWWRRPPVTRGDMRALLPFALAGIALAAVLLVRNPPAVLQAPSQFLMAGRSTWFCLGKLLWPADLLLTYPQTPVASTVVWGQWVALLALVIVPALLWRMRGRLGKAPLVGAVLILTTFVPQFFFGAGRASAWAFALDRQQYLPSISAIALLSAGLSLGIDRLSRRSRFDLSRVLRLGGGVAVVATLTTFTVMRVYAFADERTLWDDVLDHDPAWPVALHRLADMDSAAGEFGSAAARLLKLLRLHPDDEAATLDLARVYESQTRWADAADLYGQVLARRPDDDAELRARLAITWASRGRTDVALQEFQRAFALRPNDPWIATQMGIQRARRQELDGAAELFDRAIRIDPHFAQAKIELADVRFRQGRYAESAALLQDVVKVDPTNFDAYMASGTMLARLKEFTRAERMFRAAVRIRGASAPAWHNLGMVLVRTQQLGEAIYALDKATQLDPADVETRQHLESARALQREKQRDPLLLQ